MKRDEILSRVAELTSQLLDGGVTAAEADELNSLLRGNPEACELYLNLTEAHSTLLFENSEIGESNPFPEPITFPGPKRRTAIKSTGAWLGWAALFLIGLNLIILTKTFFKEAEEPSTPGDRIAVVSNLVSPRWSKTTERVKEGEALGPGMFRLEAGAAHLEFFSGASVVVEGPAQLDLQSAWKMHCFEGRLRTFVPEPARGFTITTEDYDAVDLGTEFLLEVGSNGSSELHVIDGEVQLNDKEGTELALLNTGKAIRANAGTIESTETATDAEFIGRQQLLGLAEEEWQSRYEAWTAANQSIREDDSALVVFDFEDHKPWARQLENRVESGSNGAIIGSQWTQGRWPGKGALEFTRITDRVRLHIPGEFDEVTLAARVRIESFDQWLSSLLLTDGFDRGELHWQISNKGELILGIQTGKRTPNSTSAQVISPTDLGRWLHLAVTANRITGKVTHYLDGEIVGIDRREGLPPFRLGDAEIGNWNPEKTAGHSPIRSLNGKIEEFVVLRREMTPNEIRELERSGMP